jgi:multidrug efflux pump
MTIGTFFTLFVVPSVYVLIARDHRAKGPAAPETAVTDERRERDSTEPAFAPGAAARTAGE